MNDLEALVLAHRYLYYVLFAPILTDCDYDALEQAAAEHLPDDSPVHGIGSSLSADYPKRVKLLATWLILNKED